MGKEFRVFGRSGIAEEGLELGLKKTDGSRHVHGSGTGMRIVVRGFVGFHLRELIEETAHRRAAGFGFRFVFDIMLD